MSEFVGLVEQEIPRLRRYARALTRNAERAERSRTGDASLVRAIAERHLWQMGTDLRAWLFTIMHNQNVNFVRRAMRDGTVIDIEQLSTSLVATSDPPASRQLRELERALGCLSEERRAVIPLVGLEGMSYEAAAQILNVPVGSAFTAFTRARRAPTPARSAGKSA
jgi:RNA polymerase sigma-70 factor (ECF subfamily)